MSVVVTIILTVQMLSALAMIGLILVKGAAMIATILDFDESARLA